jgi:signal transduction histidine kinase
VLAPIDRYPDTTERDVVGPRTARDWSVDAAAFVIAAALGALTLSTALNDSTNSLTSTQVALDAVLGLVCCLSLWWRRRWPFEVALICVLLGTFSTAGTVAGVLALASLAIHRSVQPVLAVAVLSVPSAVVCAIYLGRTDISTVILVTVLSAAAASGCGMAVRARRQLLFTLRDRAHRAEADQLMRAEGARLAERTRIAREMHDVMAHRISLLALHAGALEVAPDLSPEQVRESAALLRSTAHQALEELRDVIGVLREEPSNAPTPTTPQPALGDIPRLVEETRQAGAKIDFEMRVEHADMAPGALGRDAYRIVQEALTNVGKHARGTQVRVRVAGAPERGLHVSVRNPLAVGAHAGPSIPGSGTGLLGLAERVTLAGGVLVHGPDTSGDFVVEADLRW